MTSAIIVTAANNVFYRTLYQLLLSIKRHKTEKKNTILIYDLGLLPHQLEKLKKHFLSPSFKFRQFKVTGKVETFYWKPIIISNVLQEYNIPVLWLDSATVILKSLDPIFDTIKKKGCYTCYGGKHLNLEVIHEKTIKHLNIPLSTLQKRQHAGGFCGFNPKNKNALNLVTDWVKLSQQPNCISPDGSSLQNHRYDQSLLSYLLYKYEASDLIELTNDALDISEPNPIQYARTRNKVPNTIPIWMDPIVRIFFWMYRFFNVFILRVKQPFN